MNTVLKIIFFVFLSTVFLMVFCDNTTSTSPTVPVVTYFSRDTSDYTKDQVIAQYQYTGHDVFISGSLDSNGLPQRVNRLMTVHQTSGVIDAIEFGESGKVFFYDIEAGDSTPEFVIEVTRSIVSNTNVKVWATSNNTLILETEIVSENGSSGSNGRNLRSNWTDEMLEDFGLSINKFIEEEIKEGLLGDIEDLGKKFNGANVFANELIDKTEDFTEQILDKFINESPFNESSWEGEELLKDLSELAGVVSNEIDKVHSFTDDLVELISDIKVKSEKYDEDLQENPSLKAVDYDDFVLIEDCNGDAFGSAYLDSCGHCVGGKTGLTECDSADIDTNSILVDTIIFLTPHEGDEFRPGDMVEISVNVIMSNHVSEVIISSDDGFSKSFSSLNTSVIESFFGEWQTSENILPGSHTINVKAYSGNEEEIYNSITISIMDTIHDKNDTLSDTSGINDGVEPGMRAYIDGEMHEFKVASVKLRPNIVQVTGWLFKGFGDDQEEIHISISTIEEEFVGDFSGDYPMSLNKSDWPDVRGRYIRSNPYAMMYVYLETWKDQPKKGTGTCKVIRTQDILAGSFEFNAYTSDGLEEVKITGGEFNLNKADLGSSYWIEEGF